MSKGLYTTFVNINWQGHTLAATAHEDGTIHLMVDGAVQVFPNIPEAIKAYQASLEKAA